MKKTVMGFTLIEILTVLAVMAILVGILVPALNAARNAALNAKQRVQISTLENALATFRNENGYFPTSEPACIRDCITGKCVSLISPAYSGAQKLAEALLGWDLLGFHPASQWRPDGINPCAINPKTKLSDVEIYSIKKTEFFMQRRPRYLDLEKTSVFPLQQLLSFTPQQLNGQPIPPPPPLPYTFTPIVQPHLRIDRVICDVFNRFKVDVGNKRVSAGMPILYYQANPSALGLQTDPRRDLESTYRYSDNEDLLLYLAKKISQNEDAAPMVWQRDDFIKYLWDQKITSSDNYWPYKSDSYILISAGIDGLYGTADDITNFK